jgi:hypothetical protein
VDNIAGGKNTTTQFDTYLAQTLVPHLADRDEAIQSAAMRIFRALAASMSTATDVDMAYLWTHFRGVLNSETTSTVSRGKKRFEQRKI